ncbi:MAG: hypothetical protein AB1560_09025 [Pseudomonadota bacterium]
MSNRLTQARMTFEHRIDEAADFVARCKTGRHGTVNRSLFVVNQLEWAHEIAVLKIVVASENFFEQTFGLYVLGKRTATGFRVGRLRRNISSSLPQILQIFRGDRNFIGWVEPTEIIERAARWLKGGEPYQTTLTSTSQLLVYVKKMRNVIAHESDDAIEKYEKATRNLYGALPKRVSPGAQLIQPPPPAIPYLNGATLFEAILGTYRLIGQRIVP